MSDANIALLVTLALGLLGMVGLLVYVTKGVKVLAEIREAIGAVVDAFADGKVTGDEVALIRKEFADVGAAIKELVTKNSAVGSGKK